MEYRLLLPEEWARLDFLNTPTTTVPSADYAIAAVAEEAEEIVGVLFLQPALHAEPLIKLRPEVEWRKLFELLPQVAYYATVPNSKMQHIAEELGMKEIEGTLYLKEY